MKTHRQAMLLLTTGFAVILLSGCTARVPGLSGMTEAEARLTLGAAGLAAAGISYDSASTEATWTVVAQSPKSGERVKNGAVVDLVLAGPPPATVPDAIGSSQTDAAQLLESAGFILGVVSSSYDESAAVGIITTQSPAPNKRAPEGTGVAVVISKGRRPVEVPAVLGESIEAATAKLESAGFLVKAESKHDSAKKGTVLGQQPEAGQIAQPGATVNLVVSDGIELVKVPSLYYPRYWDNDAAVGERLAAILRPLGLKLDWAASETGSTDPGLSGAYYQSPKAGTLVPRGTVVVVRTPFGVAVP